ncbi:hypothetical protein JR316_0001460 [Psilocybe cubensis]|uniref:Uncharacterized protein n=1 Tax=Psilocybe cubensis TaxID=181762 RepID=A0ACB8HJ82_PSICU|nr:hypothetical protein JR316_0001460 [Psilocybe cubensis]KAH9487385.1 hypothetical protein JR316_0001460 [Psilocybe cubensis]
MSFLASDSLRTCVSQSFFPRDVASLPDSTADDSLFTDRSIWSIIWSCTATIFACTWISVHQNVPAPNDSSIRVLGRRLAIMLNLFIAPEMVIVWTTRQYLAASVIVKRHKSRGWTKTHAFFVIMGGFSLYQDGVLLRTLELSELERLDQEGKIEWPTITEAEIQDKSKGDFFTKGIVVLQTTWFVVQCIVRGTKRLVLTELEIVTLAFSAITIITYALWWSKPLDVQVSVPVHLKKGCSADPEPTEPEEEKGETKSTSVDAVSEAIDPVPSGSEVVQLPGPPTQAVDTEVPLLASMPTAEIPASSDADVESQSDSLHSKLATQVPPPTFDRPYHDPSLSLLQQFRVYLKVKREEYGLIGCILYIVIYRPLAMFFGGFYDMLFCTTLEGRRYRVPTFYCPPIEDDSLGIVLAIFVALVFGGIHCIAWSFHFPTDIEKWAWRVSSVLVSGIPLAVSFLSVLTASTSTKEDGKDVYSSSVIEWIDNITIVILVLSVLTYIAARGVLLVLPIIALRALPPGAYVDLNWTVYLPHI